MNRRRNLLAIAASAFLLLWLVPKLQLGPWASDYSQQGLLKYGPYGNALSDIPYFLRAIGLGFLAMVVVEPLKWLVRSKSVALGFAAYQVALLVDAVRTNAIDWFIYCLHNLGIAEVEVDFGVRPGLPISLAFPWISFSVLVLLSLAVWKSSIQGDQAATYSRKGRPALIAQVSLCVGAGITAALLVALNLNLARSLDEPVYWWRAGTLVAGFCALTVAAIKLGRTLKANR